MTNNQVFVFQGGEPPWKTLIDRQKDQLIRSIRAVGKVP